MPLLSRWNREHHPQNTWQESLLVFRRETPQVTIVDSPETQQELSLVSVYFPFDFISFFFTFIVCDVCECFAYMSTCAQHEFKAPGGQGRASDPLGLELQILWTIMWVQRTEPLSSERALSALNAESSLQSLFHIVHVYLLKCQLLPPWGLLPLLILLPCPWSLVR